MKASGRAAARRWVAFQPVQWPGTNRSTPRSVRAAMVCSKTAPVRWELGGGRRSSVPVGKVILRSPPGLGVDQQGQAAAGTGGQALKPAVVVDVAVGDDDGPQLGRVDLRDVEVVDQTVRGQAAVVQDPAHPVGTGQQDVDEAVDHRVTSTASTGCSSTMRGSLPFPAVGEEGSPCCLRRR
jgi:hypothetical protein